MTGRGEFGEFRSRITRPLCHKSSPRSSLSIRARKVYVDRLRVGRKRAKFHVSCRKAVWLGMTETGGVERYSHTSNWLERWMTVGVEHI